MSELDSDSLTELIAVGDMSEFNQEQSTTRTPYWPNDYQEGDIDMQNIRIWKMSHSPDVFEPKHITWLTEHCSVAIHKGTKNGSVPCFEKMSKGDIVSLGHGNTVFRIVRIISDIEANPDSPLGEEWLLRRYEIIKGLDKPVNYEGKRSTYKIQLKDFKVTSEGKEIEIETDFSESKIHLVIDDDDFEYTFNMDKSDNILEEGINQGLDLPYSCKGGVCCTCRAKVLEGSAKMKINYALTEGEVEDGYILTCQAIPTSSSIKVSFDD